MTGGTLVPAVEVASIFVLAAFVAAQPREERAGLWHNAVLIGVGAVLGEETCIAFYRFYAYSPAWSVKVYAVPVMVGCIWPAVVLSARQVAGVLAPAGLRRAFWVAGIVCFDATLVEAVSVRAGLWSWEEGAVFGVPLPGLVGWAAFAGFSALAMDLGWHPAARLVLPALFTHGVLVATWWGGLRWMLRTPLAAEWLVGVSVMVAVTVTVMRRADRARVPLQVMGPRALAAGLFFVLVGVTAAGDVGGGAWLAAFVAPFSLPYVWLTAWRRRA